MSPERERLAERAALLTDYVGLYDLTLDELCRLVPIMEQAWERLRVPARSDNVISFAACRRRRARRLASRSQFVGADD